MREGGQINDAAQREDGCWEWAGGFEMLEGRRGETGIFGLEEKADERTPEFGRGDGCVRPRR